MIQRDFLNFLRTPDDMEFTGKFDIPKFKDINYRYYKGDLIEY